MDTVSTTHATHVLGTPLTAASIESIDSGMILPDIDRRLLKIRPMATPVDQISRSARSRASGSMEVRYYTVDSRPSSAEVKSVAGSDGNDGEFLMALVEKKRLQGIFKNRYRAPYRGAGWRQVAYFLCIRGRHPGTFGGVCRSRR
ncbi:hypothetical protein [Muribaculum intestinale]|uniref:hypothetical protein n=1 Tax=Muribaculum intestinale TaxID=1796646 RepID=UPI00243021D1|nr:hypothetical protein [Muribaculum intestinale]